MIFFMSVDPQMSCPCGSQKKYISCCGAYHQGETLPTAEALMRARYAAYVVANIDFIEKSTHPKIKDEFDYNASKEWAESAKWLGLKVLKTEGGLSSDSKGSVDFEAHFEMNGKKEVYAEHALFERAGAKNAWFFLDGKPIADKPFVRSAPKQQRNEPCLCGSGLKYKNCCGK